MQRHTDPRLIAAGVCLGAYVLSYVAISPFGAYAESSFGLSGPISYQWAPPGFYDPVREKWIHPELEIFYAPLSILDHHLWHNHWWKGPRYPVATPAPRKAQLVTGEQPQ